MHKQKYIQQDIMSSYNQKQDMHKHNYNKIIWKRKKKSWLNLRLIKQE